MILTPWPPVIHLLPTRPIYPKQAGKAAAKPLYRDPVFDGAADASLCYNRQEHKWLMFYTNRRATLA